MLEAAMWGAIASFSLLAGSVTGLFLSIPKRIIAYFMALGTGILIGASSFELLIESVNKSGMLTTAIAFLAGACLFTIIEIFLYQKGGSNRKRSHKNPEGHSGLAIFVGTLMDAIPESMIIGLSLLYTHKVDLLFLIAIFISNFPESLSSTVGLKKDQYSNKKILTLWSSVIIISAISSSVGYLFLENASPTMLSSIQSFGAGGLIAMVCSTMLPEAFEQGGPTVGFVACVGLIFSLSMSHIG
jgi:zinc transporter, ZIP family